MQKEPTLLQFKVSCNDKWITVEWMDSKGDIRKEIVLDVYYLQNLTVLLEFSDHTEEFQCNSLNELQGLQQLIEPLGIHLFLNQVAQQHRVNINPYLVNWFI